MTWTTDTRGKVGGGVLIALLGAGIPALVGAALHGHTGVPYRETRLYFGTERPGGAPPVGEREFDRFIDRKITPAFPEGLTVQPGHGQWREPSGRIVHETSYEVVLLYPDKGADERGVRIEEIRRAYRKEFAQDSVLRSDAEVSADY
ncbi:DUF3574 domain-containing protein [Streptomyces sp. G-G2]|uniref:DUF3574 domain-containing protein n=1 Tax=Streptomyces sp. G-G2 TaxID=3046201 RepID=UPI0024BB781D|nr:DUF3574 domain-containing protein [Streptomyces sp. G-G2]MDJ0381512.1 DUF3574 domain-containing protein [Streptomyces sp. G-G2]